jgi:superfamily II DNA or RNA helicase
MLAMREWLHSGHPVLVLVPSELLLLQWEREIREELHDLKLKLLLVGGGHSLWRHQDVVEGFTAPDGGPRVVIATLQTASTDAFLSRIWRGDHLFMVVDEVYRAGSPIMSSILTIDAGARLGLSATPRRFGDPVGTSHLFSYFGGIVQPVFTLADAIRTDALCQYRYFVHTVNLTDDELVRWSELTEQFGREMMRTKRSKSGRRELTEWSKMLLIRRARIVKLASQKVALAVTVLREHFQAGQRWLIYCDDQSQLRQVQHALETEGIDCDEYHSAMAGHRESTLEHFVRAGGILIAIRCLDEGVDIPVIDHALILASSRNPREYIQRRGRILRKSEGKHFAEVHDALVVPPEEDDDALSILRGELTRAEEFAASAINTSVSYQLKSIARLAGIDVGTLSEVGDFGDFGDEDDAEGVESGDAG